MGLKTEYLVLAATLHRRFRTRARWIAVTGSSGKSTTCVLLAGMLRALGPVRDGSVLTAGNTIKQLGATVLGTARDDLFGVAELSGAHPGMILRKTAILKPEIGIVTTIGADHRSSYATLADTAREKGHLIRALPAHGVAVLNTDDPLVWAMREETDARIVGFGRAAHADVRIVEATADWPARLTMRIACRGREFPVATQFVGPRAAHSVAAAIAAATAAGVPLEEAVASVATVPPLPGRMMPVERRGNYTMIDDSWKGAIDSYPAALDFLARASAGRKILVVGEISDTRRNKGRVYRSVAREALAVADALFFVGPWAGSAARLKDERSAGRLMAFDTIREAAAALSAYLRPGDLVLMKGSQRADHLERLLFDDATCRLGRCGLVIRCSGCELLRVPESAEDVRG